MSLLLSSCCNLKTTQLPTQQPLLAIECWLKWLEKHGLTDQAKHARTITERFFHPRYLGTPGYQPHSFDLAWMCLEAKEGGPPWMPELEQKYHRQVPAFGIDNNDSKPECLIWHNLPCRSGEVSLSLLSRNGRGEDSGYAREFWLLLGTGNGTKLLDDEAQLFNTTMAEMFELCKALENPSEAEAG